MIKSLGSAQMAHMIEDRFDYVSVESENGHMFIGISIWFAGSVVENIHYKVFKTNEETGDDNIVVNKMLWSHSITKSSYSKELENKIFNVLLEYMDIEYNRLTDLYLLTMQRIREIIGLFNE